MQEPTTAVVSTPPTIKKLDEVRLTGYRPTVVVCFVNARKTVLFFKKEYRLWLLPQSGIDAKDSPEKSAGKLISEELGANYLKKCEKSLEYLGEDQVEFLPEKQTGEEMELSDGSKKIKIVGKHYYFYAVNVNTDEVTLSDTIYDEYYWLESKPALALSSKIYQPGKRRITMKAINLLKEKNLVD